MYNSSFICIRIFFLYTLRLFIKIHFLWFFFFNFFFLSHDFYFLFVPFSHTLLVCSYALSQSGTYRVPLNPTRVNALEYIADFPLSPHPEVYGLHENADINRNNKETNGVRVWCQYKSSNLQNLFFIYFFSLTAYTRRFKNTNRLNGFCQIEWRRSIWRQGRSSLSDMQRYIGTSTRCF